jgi:23S rRNA pseudouridine2605 synthase
LLPSSDFQLHPSRFKPASMRLNKFIAGCGVCSRRDADALIASGRISINGEPVRDLGRRVLPDDRVSLDGRPLLLQRTLHFLLNKPAGCITTMEDTHDRPTVSDLMRDAAPERLYPVGRLDLDTTGLLIMTNDGDLAARLAHPSSEIQKVYEVVLDVPLSAVAISRLRQGIELEDGPIRPDLVEWTPKTPRTARVTLHSGRNRIVRRMFQHLGANVVGLDRVRFADLTLEGVRRGAWRALSPAEVETLRRLCGLRMIDS